jgi:hypothetical protein
MAIPWLTALKIIPWSDVIEATPALVKGARKLFTRSQEEAQQSTQPGVPAGAAPPQTLAEALLRLQQLEAEQGQLARQQADSAALLQSLAEQNARLVAAIEQLRQRSKLLLYATGVLSALALALLAWAALR